MGGEISHRFIAIAASVKEGTVNDFPGVGV